MLQHILLVLEAAEPVRFSGFVCLSSCQVSFFFTIPFRLVAGTLRATAADFDVPFTGSVSSATGGVSFQTAEAADPAQELEVIKAILLREGYLKRLQSLARKQANEGGAVRPDLVDLLDLMRVASVEVVEAVVKWRRGLVCVPLPTNHGAVVVNSVVVGVLRWNRVLSSGTA
jgi:hypothetical protein